MENSELLGQDVLPTTTPTSDEKTMAVLSHILTIVVGFLAPLIIYLLKKDESPFVSAHAKESLNFQITMFLIYIACGILVLLIIGIFMIWAALIIQLILAIIASVKASEGKLYKYPFCLRIIK